MFCLFSTYLHTFFLSSQRDKCKHTSPGDFFSLIDTFKYKKGNAESEGDIDGSDANFCGSHTNRFITKQRVNS